MQSPNHLIIVCGHAIWAGGPSKGQDESEWIIEDWKKGESPTYTAHIKAGLKKLSEDDRAMLVFSGGPTAASNPVSEARSYANLAAANSYWDFLGSSPAPSAILTRSHPLSPIPLHQRIECEERAMDSYQNILFSTIQFWRTTSRWPSLLTIVSHTFKRRRLAEVHCKAMVFPLEKVCFVGINPPGVPDVVDREEDAVNEWIRDPQGQSDSLKTKRTRRNLWGVSQMLFLSEDERQNSGIVTDLLKDGEEILVEGGARPWGQD
ncbi:folylpolyglutamate synthase [Diaporthe australafricana]|uniref:Folylpolyglutamate synthase n=1 Tax=Diaporthe australafricana TaxID=127596 RepID=A0ABR3WNK8_9PEZI